MAGAVRRLVITGLYDISRSRCMGLSSSHSVAVSSNLLLSSIANAIRYASFNATRINDSDLDPGEDVRTREPSDRVRRTNVVMPSGGSAPIDVSNLERIEKSVNKVTLMGRVGSEPQLRGTEQNPILIFSLATHENYRNEEGLLKQKTMWHRIGIFKGGLRESVFKWLKKGQRLYVNGSLSYGNVKDAETNTVRVVTTILADEVIVLAGPSAYSSPSNAPTADSAA